MIPNPLEAINEAALQALIANPVREKRTIDYKVQTYGNSHAQHRELLADVSSFANSVGGDLAIGIQEKGGVPVSLPGVQLASVDDEIQRLQQILLYGLEPRLSGVEIHPASLSNGNHVLVIRVLRSWNVPHRVVLQGHDKFYARDTNGKHPMNVDELRDAFSLADRVEQRIRGFRRERFQAIKTNHAQEPLQDGAALILHLIPLSAATSPEALDISAMREKQTLLRAIGSGGSTRINLDGIIFYSGDTSGGTRQPSDAYTQLYRNGTIEAVTVFTIWNDERTIPSQLYEANVIQALGPYLQAQRELGIVAPVYLFLGLANSGQYRFAVNKSLFFPRGPRSPGYLDRDDIELIEGVIEDLTDEPIKILLPLFDQMWQAFGFERSYNFDEEGKWTGQER